MPGVLQGGVTLVVSPLIELMHDQVRNLNEHGISAVSLDSTIMDKRVEKLLYQQIKDGRYTFVYVSPERLGTKRFIENMINIELTRFAVDEAHCVCEWGYDFRPDYMKIKRIHSLCFSNAPLIALTATATTSVREDIIDKLELKDCFQFHGSVFRSNISLDREEVYSERDRIAFLEAFILRQAVRSEPTVIYCRKKDKIRDLVQFAYRHRLPIGEYHADLSGEQRTFEAEQFRENKVNVLLATSAYGMGIDKPDIRFILHESPPDSLEQYCQQFGRAGRDGESAKAHVLYTLKDLGQNKTDVHTAVPSLSFVMHVWSRVVRLIQKVAQSDFDSVRLEGIPFNVEIFTKRNEASQGNDRYKTQVVSSLAALERVGLFTIQMGKLFPVIDPKAVEGDNFPLTENMIASRVAEKRVGVELMRYYLMSGEEPWGIIRDYFTSERIKQRAASFDFASKKLIPDEDKEHILRAVAVEPLTKMQIANYLAGEGKDRGELYGVQSELDVHEVICQIDVLLAQDLLKTIEKGANKRQLLVLTKTGKSMLPLEYQVETKRPDSWSELKKQVHTDVVQSIIREVCREWFLSQYEEYGDSKAAWQLIVKGFLDGTFEIPFSKPKQATGRDIIAAVKMKKTKSVSSYEVIGVLNDLYGKGLRI